MTTVQRSAASEGIMMQRRQQIAAAVKKARTSLGLTQAQLAEQVGVHEQTIGNIERGTVDVSNDVMGRVEQVLEITLSPQRLASQAAAQVIFDQIEVKLAGLSESDGLVLAGEVLRFVIGWQPSPPISAEVDLDQV